MSLQTRLFLFFIAIVVFPLAIAAFVGQRLIVRELEDRTFSSLSGAETAAVAVYQEATYRSADRLQLIAGDERFQSALLAGKYEDLKNRVIERFAEPQNTLDFVVVAEPDGRVLAAHLREAEFLTGVVAPSPEELVATSQVSRSLLAVRNQVIVPKGPGTPTETGYRIWGGFYLDNEFTQRLRETTGQVDATFVIDSRPVSSTLAALQDEAQPGRVFFPSGNSQFIRTTIANSPVYAATNPILTDVDVRRAALMMSLPSSVVANLQSRVNTFVYLLMILALVGAGLLGFMLARIIARPLREVAAAANAIAAGNYEQNIEIRSASEVGQLARSFNEMARRVVLHIEELRESREDLKRAYARFSETLRATHDLNSLLPVILDNCIDTLRAERGALMMVESDGGLAIKVTRGITDAEFADEITNGLAALVASTGEPIRYPSPTDPGPQGAEAASRTIMSAPMFRQEDVVGVVNLYNKHGEQDFSEADMGTLLSLADQAGVALENVFLHDETKKLSITDNLTGIANQRFFQERLEDEINRSDRFGATFSLITFDIDNFKSFNDTYGHLMGDAVLQELARRVQRTVRDVDTFARYGGEEFVIILPGTNLTGGLATAEKIRELIAAEPIRKDSTEVNVTVSVGVATFPDHARDKKAIYEAADSAMYVAKRSGKNRVAAYNVW